MQRNENFDQKLLVFDFQRQSKTVDDAAKRSDRCQATHEQ